jgi:hypothetical protein
MRHAESLAVLIFVFLLGAVFGALAYFFVEQLGVPL